MEHKLTTVRVKAGEGDLTEGRFQAGGRCGEAQCMVSTRPSK